MLTASQPFRGCGVDAAFALILLFAIAAAASADARDSGIYTITVCPWSAEHPRNDSGQIFVLRDGRLLLAWNEYYVKSPRLATRYRNTGAQIGDRSPCRICGKISQDRGRSWSDSFVLQEAVGLTAKGPNLLRLPSDEIIFLYRESQSNPPRNGIYLRRSSDECATWSEAVKISPVYHISSGRIFKHSSGRIVLPVAGRPQDTTGSPADKPVIHPEEISGGDSQLGPNRAFCLYSDDDGETWRESLNALALPGRGAEEPAMVELRDGSILTVLRTHLGKIYLARSHNRGETWTHLWATNLDAPASQAELKVVPGTGDLLLVWNHCIPNAFAKLPSTHRWRDQTNRPRNPLACAISQDDGKTWGMIKNVENCQNYHNAYPSLTFVEDDAFVTFHQAWHEHAGDKELILKIIPVRWFYR